MKFAQVADEYGPRTGATQEWVYNVLHYGIISGSFESGMQLKQDDISAALNVSHIPVREALRQLEVQGLVTILPNRGASVSSPSRNEIQDMLEVRAALEGMCLANSAALLEESDIALLQQINREMRYEKDAKKLEQLNRSFHDTLLGYDENGLAKKLIINIHDNIDRFVRACIFGREDRKKRLLSEHDAILEACLDKDFRGAGELLTAHVRNAKDFIPIKLENSK